MSDIRVTFVLPANSTDENEVSEAMGLAYELCKQQVDTVSWAKETDLKKMDFTKKDYVVFEDFDGKDFSQLINSKAAVVGPLAISVCLMEGRPIPSFQWPILNVAMYDCVVTCSQMTKSAKEQIQRKVQLMGGCYTGSFTHAVTHLVCNGTKSEKYILSAEKGVNIMIPDWIDHIFEASKRKNVSANDPEIIKKYKGPPFYKLTICSTGITGSKDKAKLSEIITADGGRLTARLNVAETDVLICHEVNGTTSEKFKAARRVNLPCVKVDWVFDSIEKRYAVPYEKYYIKTVTSTPTKEGENIDPNFSAISCIGSLGISKSTINETVDTTQVSTTAVVGGIIEGTNKRKASDLMEKLDIKKVKNAGQFLDGCSVFVTGFSPERRDKLNRIVNLSGATRYDEFSERVTHIIVGDPNCYEVKAIKAKQISCALVSVEWLLDSIEQQRPAKEDTYLITHKELDDGVDQGKMGSPLSKKALNLLKSTNIRVPNKEDQEKLHEPAGEQDDPLTQQYLKNATSEKDEDTLAMLLKNQNGTAMSKKVSSEDEFILRTRPFNHKSSTADQEKNEPLVFKPHETSTQVSQVTSDCSQNDTDVIPIFSAYNFYLCGFSEEHMYACEEHIRGVGGSIVDKNFKGIADYAVVPAFNQPADLPPVQEIVNDLWIIQSLDEERACEIQYYHRPMALPSTMPLKNCVVTISVYAGQERHFLNLVIEGLGGIFQEQFSRKNLPAKNVLASTHLVSSEAGGKKYEAALKWNVPVVNKDWLLECARTGTKVDVKRFLISNNKPADISATTNNDTKKSNTSSNNSGQMQDGKAFKEASAKSIESRNKEDTDRSNSKLDQLDEVFIPERVKRTSNGSNTKPADIAATTNNDTKKSNTSSNISRQMQDGEVCKKTSAKSIDNKSCNKEDTDESSSKLEQLDEVFTPERANRTSNDMKTPIQQIYNLHQKDTSETCSQVTPVNKVLQQFNADHGKLLPTPSPKTYEPWDPKTPDTPIGAFIRPNPSPRLRKEMQKYINSFPDFVPPRPRRHSTPLSELKRRLRNKVLGIGEYAPQNTQDEAGPSTQAESSPDFNGESNEPRTELEDRSFEIEDDLKDTEKEPVVNPVVQQKLQELQQMVMANGSASATRRSSRTFEASTNPLGIVTTDNEVQSQVCTVGWDYGESEMQTPPPKVFLLSGIDSSQREQLSQELKNLGGTVLDSSTYEAACTHLVCPKPSRNEKTLACMAAGKWILHFSYVEKSVKAGKFLDEEEFEFGNPKARKNISYEEKDSAIYFWRKEVKRRGYGAFNDMRAIVVAEKKEPIANVIEAGGGVVVRVTPPFNDPIHATHCLLEMKMVKCFSKYIPLAQQGIKCVNTIYVSDFLWRIKKDDSDYIIPYFAKYY